MHFVFILKQGGVIVFENTVMEVKENQGNLKFNGIHQLVIHAHDVDSLAENINSIKENI
jgi:hypothetical protein